MIKEPTTVVAMPTNFLFVKDSHPNEQEMAVAKTQMEGCHAAQDVA
eukprot:CAMPEP_0172914780 /NCGR_PEP_ID=MMETSP1075-20121228/193039_1 /TAXON_ID=2916 /ORGANISM="Ceratium fusus, Strain PA161109" /LENGTH=45 /DNA_ID= /DNA_START= /DNA_END= /DNA_ORIENTATION=